MGRTRADESLLCITRAKTGSISLSCCAMSGADMGQPGVEASSSTFLDRSAHLLCGRNTTLRSHPAIKRTRTSGVRSMAPRACGSRSAHGFAPFCYHAVPMALERWPETTLRIASTTLRMNFQKELAYQMQQPHQW
eukprot:1218634-Rhodomonas_salina.1